MTAYAVELLRRFDRAHTLGPSKALAEVGSTELGPPEVLRPPLTSSQAGRPAPTVIRRLGMRRASQISQSRSVPRAIAGSGATGCDTDGGACRWVEPC
jgi:hypothetical protein